MKHLSQVPGPPYNGSHWTVVKGQSWLQNGMGSRPVSVTRPAQKPVPPILGMFQNIAKDRECRAARERSGPVPRAPGYLDGGGAALLVLALTQQAVGLHVVAGHRHGLHHVQAVAATETDGAVGAGPLAAGNPGGDSGAEVRGLPGHGEKPPPNPPAPAL